MTARKVSEVYKKMNDFSQKHDSFQAEKFISLYSFVVYAFGLCFSFFSLFFLFVLRKIKHRRAEIWHDINSIIYSYVICIDHRIPFPIVLIAHSILFITHKIITIQSK